MKARFLLILTAIAPLSVLLWLEAPEPPILAGRDGVPSRRVGGGSR